MVKTYFVSRFNETKKIGPKYQKTAEDMLHKFEDGLIHESKTMGINFLGDLIKIIMGLDPTGSLECKNNSRYFHASFILFLQFSKFQRLVIIHIGFDF